MKMTIKKLPVFILLLLLTGCGDNWEKRYRKEAKDKCDCMKPWQSTVSKNLEHLYFTADSIFSHHVSDYDERGQGISDEDLQVLRDLKMRLSADELEWSIKLGREFRDQNSELYKCWHKEYPWDKEIPGNNVKYTVDSHAMQMKCSLVNYIIELGNQEDIMTILFD